MVRPLFLHELAHEGQIIGHNLLLEHLSALGGHGGGFPLVYPGLDLPQAGVEAHSLRIGGGYLHAVVFGGIVAGRNLDGGVKTVIGRAEIHHRRRTEADIVNIGPGIVDASYHRVMNLV